MAHFLPRHSRSPSNSRHASKSRSSSVGSNSSHSSDGSARSHPFGRNGGDYKDGELPPPVLVYHESARSIVFRDHLRRVASKDVSNSKQLKGGSSNVSNISTDSNENDDDNNNNDDAGKPAAVESIKGQKLDPIPSATMVQQQQQQQQQQVDGHGAASEQHKQQHETHSALQDVGSDLVDLANVFMPNAGADLPYLNENNIQIVGFQPNIVPLDQLELGPKDEFLPLLESGMDEKVSQEWTKAEQQVVTLLRDQKAVVKTIKNADWTDFLHRFRLPKQGRNSRYHDAHDDIGPSDARFPFTSFVTSTSLLPPFGKKMRCFGASEVYTTGVVFALPSYDTPEQEAEAAERTHTWSWPAGYSAKTEFNIDSRGNLINGRQESLVSLSQLRQLNEDYTTKEDYVVAGRVITGGLKTVPYNEIFVRVGGRGRIVDEKDVAVGEERVDQNGTGRSLEKGVGLPVALFVRTPTFGHLISLFRTRARLLHVLGESHVAGIPLLLISPDFGVRVLTEKLQRNILKIAAQSLNPFQNPMLAHKTKIDDTSASHLETKLEELIDLDDTIRTTLTPEECARLAGGFGATDDSIAQILKDAMMEDKASAQAAENGGPATESHKLQDIVNEGLAAAVRSGDYYTSRQLLILYSLVASEGLKVDSKEETKASADGKDADKSKKLVKKKSSDAMLVKKLSSELSSASDVPPRPPPPPLDTDRLRSATNSDGLLAVLGAAEVLKAMQDGSAKKRTEECVAAVEE
jgi:hypothetical protein